MTAVVVVRESWTRAAAAMREIWRRKNHRNHGGQLGSRS
jgi:hypothetical protein